MKLSQRWLHDLVPGLHMDTEALSHHLALRGAPVESTRSPGTGLADIVVGKVLRAGPHPNADRLSLCTVDGGAGEVQVVCGAPNVREGAWYPFAPVGAVLPGDFKIKKAKIRGEVSEGMLCSAKELGLGTDHSGILEIQGDFEPGQPFVVALGLDDVTLDVEVTANRGDLLSHVGVARELATEGDGEVVLPAVPSDPGTAVQYVTGAPGVEVGGVSIRIEDPDLCPRYLGAVIRDVAVGPSPAWLQERLRGAGARPINNVVDATNYVMLELGQPLHAFDLDRLGGQGIVVRRAAGAEKGFTTLDGESRALSTDMLMICDLERPVAIGGVMGGLDSEVASTTTDVLLECALFEPKAIRRTRKALGLSTDASYRFERGVDPEGLRRAVERCVAIILATAGGSLDGPILDCAPAAFEPDVVSLRLARVERLLGVPFEARYVRELLEPLGFAIVAEREDVLEVRVPGFRSYDVTREVDLIEEIARTHGYDEFPAELGPARPGRVPDHPLFRLEDEIRDLLVARGLFEAQTPAFAPPGEGDVEVANPLASTEPFMRRELLPSLLRRIEHNLARGNRDVRLFEIGTSFERGCSGEPPNERTHLAAVLTGRRAPPHWAHEDEPLTLWDLKGLLEDSARAAYRGPMPLGKADPAPTRFDHGHCFAVHDGTGAVVGHGGRVRQGVVDAPAWADAVWAFELVLPSEAPEPRIVRAAPLPHLPASERDLALIVPEGIAAATVEMLVREGAGAELEWVQLFDLYTGAGIPKGSRSLAYRLRFRSSTRTLKDEEVDKTVAGVLRRLEEELGVQSRG